MEIESLRSERSAGCAPTLPAHPPATDIAQQPTTPEPNLPELVREGAPLKGNEVALAVSLQGFTSATRSNGVGFTTIPNYSN
jgi:hypothetical protein